MAKTKAVYFLYGEKETEYLKQKDKNLAPIIEQIGHIKRECHCDLFAALIHCIVGQQISTKAQESIWNKIISSLKEINPDTILKTGRENLQKFGISFKKVDYIIDFAQKVKSKELDLINLYKKSDEDVIKELSSLRGVGVWTAEMLMLFCMQRPNVLSYNDLAIQRGMRMVYRHKKITKKLFEKYKKRLSPYCSVASLYFWAVAGGAIDELTDPALRTAAKKEK